MKTETSKTDKCRVELKVTLDAGETTKVVREVERAFVREVRMPGFRPGKVPLDMIRRNYADDIKRETISALCKNNLDEAIKASGLDVVGVAEVKDVAYDENGGGFTASVDVKPTFKLPKYKGLSIVKNDVTVPEAEVADANGLGIGVILAGYMIGHEVDDDLESCLVRTFHQQFELADAFLRVFRQVGVNVVVVADGVRTASFTLHHIGVVGSNANG